MKLNEVVRQVAQRSGVNQKNVKAVLYAYSEVVLDSLLESSADKIPLPEIGSFSVKMVRPRHCKVINGEHKGEDFYSPAHPEIAFHIYDKFRRSVYLDD